ncbi:MAG: YdcF family protein [Merismopedia sp. SIO2A8]|nr:YdcF family protein [Symploca sp. SIO2B6]NET54270.1 YdcF family protein [Merismopedia sp. SIO2A8]
MGLNRRQNKWVLMFINLLFALIFTAFLIWYMLKNVYLFLAINSPIKADILVVEGWIPDYALKEAIDEFKNGDYQKLVTTGLPLEKGYYLAKYKNSAELAAATLMALAFEQDKLISVPGQAVTKNRTAASAIALRRWIQSSDLKIKSINLYTFSTHARRSWLIFKQALAPEIQVGIISVAPLNYEPQQWWVSSAGFRSVINEIIAYLYARLVDWRA